MRHVSTTRAPKNKEPGCYFLFLRPTPLKSSYKTSNQSFSAIDLIQSFFLILSPCFTLRHLTVLLLWRGWEQIKARGVFGSTLFWFWTMICWNTLVRMFPISFCWFVRTFFTYNGNLRARIKLLTSVKMRCCLPVDAARTQSFLQVHKFHVMLVKFLLKYKSSGYMGLILILKREKKNL